MTLLEELLPRVEGATVDDGFAPATLDVPLDGWAGAVAAAKGLGATYFDFLSAVDEPDGIRVVCHLVRPVPFEHLVLRTVLDTAATVASVASVFEGAAWHERETAEMFGVTFLDGSGEPLRLAPLLLPPGFPHHPLRKDYALQARVETPWPGEKEPS
ncbi:NADH-quinone oxidoreductase subunit C [Nocardioides caldifontis]|uniref:NADH-quinone oxidoreductase subunit C n=1 Tax=Nocardioides caldifontis TaxID=2588938 RepID=UPI0013969E1A|nr:NADH-quinone oxidoreductase subunit C [Nocardioides caldifontis]